MDEMLNRYKGFDIFIYSATWCPYCEEAKRVANLIKGISVGVLEFDELPGEGEEIKAALIKKTG